MISYRDVITGLAKLDVSRDVPVLVHSSLSAFGQVKGGAQTVVGALLATWDTVLMPAFTYTTMLIPEQGPANNGLKYGSGRDVNRLTVPFKMDMPVDRLTGIIPETFRQLPTVTRTNHPILSFLGIHAHTILTAQSILEPLNLVRSLQEKQGWVILLGVDHTANSSIHQAERLAGRKQFIRWATTPGKVMECPNMPGCSDGFQKAASLLEPVTRRLTVGDAIVQAIPLKEMIPLIVVRLRRDPFALLCDRPDCERCNTVRNSIRHRKT